MLGFEEGGEQSVRALQIAFSTIGGNILVYPQCTPLQRFWLLSSVSLNVESESYTIVVLGEAPNPTSPPFFPLFSFSSRLPGVIDRLNNGKRHPMPDRGLRFDDIRVVSEVRNLGEPVQ